MATATVEVWAVVDECGDYAIGTDADNAHENYRDNIGATDVALRVVKMLITVPCPKPMEIVGTIPAEPDEAGQVVLAVA